MGFNFYKPKNAFNWVASLTFSLCFYSNVIHAGAFYRYVNEEGVKVLDTSIPPEYVQNGYEILNKNGQVIEVVPPAPSEEEIAEKQTEQEILFHYELLRKRYSNVSSIESARKRKLENLETSISIIKGNI